MADWYSVETDTQTERLLGAWPGAPAENLELLGMLLDTARNAVVTYAPPFDETPVEGLHITLPPDNPADFMYSATLPITIIQPPTAVGYANISWARFGATPGGTPNADPTVLEAELRAQGVEATVTGVTGRTYRIEARGVVLTGDIEDDETGEITTLFPLVTTMTSTGETRYQWIYAAPLAGGVPTEYAYVQLRHAVALWNTGADTGAGISDDGFQAYIERPLDATLKKILRPVHGYSHAL